MNQLGQEVERPPQLLFFLVIDLVTAQAGYKSSFSSLDATSDVNVSQTIGSGTTLPPAKSLPSNKETP